MKLAQLFPIQNCVIKGCSVIENVFGANFVVYDATGAMLTTAKNVKLFRRAQTLVENLPLYDAQGLAHVLAELREDSDLLRQSDYDRTVWRERQNLTSADTEFRVWAGSHE